MVLFFDFIYNNWMKKFAILLFFFTLFIPLTLADEVVLETGVSEAENGKLNESLYERIKQINSKDFSDISERHYLLEDILNKEFEGGIVKNVHLFGYYRGGVDFNLSGDDKDVEYDFNSISGCINGKIFNEDTSYELWLRVNPEHGYSFWQYLPSNMYIANKSIPNTTIMFGNSRTPVGVEGGKSMLDIPFVTRAQISRNYGNIRKVGLRVKGSYDLFEYDIGGYNSDTYFRSFFPGAEFAGWAGIKPLGKTDGKYGNLRLGGTFNAGHNNINYCVAGFSADYEYKKIIANFEYLAANGYNGAKTLSANHSDGFYTTLGYNLTPKIQVLGRYDHYVPNKLSPNDIRREYSAGLNYFIKGQALKLMLNYVFCQNDLQKDSHRIILGTQILL